MCFVSRGILYKTREYIWMVKKPAAYPEVKKTALKKKKRKLVPSQRVERLVLCGAGAIWSINHYLVI